MVMKVNDKRTKEKVPFSNLDIGEAFFDKDMNFCIKTDYDMCIWYNVRENEWERYQTDAQEACFPVAVEINVLD